MNLTKSDLESMKVARREIEAQRHGPALVPPREHAPYAGDKCLRVVNRKPCAGWRPAVGRVLCVECQKFLTEQRVGREFVFLGRADYQYR